MSHVTHTNEACHTYEQVISLVRVFGCVCVCVCACRYESGEVAAADTSFCFTPRIYSFGFAKECVKVCEVTCSAADPSFCSSDSLVGFANAGTQQVHTQTRTHTHLRTATHCNALQRTATHCNALQVAVSLSHSHISGRQSLPTTCNALQLALQHTSVFVSDWRTASCSGRCSVLQQHYESLHTQVAVSLSHSHVSNERTANCSARSSVLLQTHTPTHTHIHNKKHAPTHCNALQRTASCSITFTFTHVELAHCKLQCALQ